MKLFSTFHIRKIGDVLMFSMKILENFAACGGDFSVFRKKILEISKISPRLILEKFENFQDFILEIVSHKIILEFPRLILGKKRYASYISSVVFQLINPPPFEEKCSRPPLNYELLVILYLFICTKNRSSVCSNSKSFSFL